MEGKFKDIKPFINGNMVAKHTSKDAVWYCYESKQREFKEENIASDILSDIIKEVRSQQNEYFSSKTNINIICPRRLDCVIIRGKGENQIIYLMTNIESMFESIFEYIPNINWELVEIKGEDICLKKKKDTSLSTKY